MNILPYSVSPRSQSSIFHLSKCHHTLIPEIKLMYIFVSLKFTNIFLNLHQHVIFLGKQPSLIHMFSNITPSCCSIVAVLHWQGKTLTYFHVSSMSYRLPVNSFKVEPIMSVRLYQVGATGPIDV